MYILAMLTHERRNRGGVVLSIFGLDWMTDSVALVEWTPGMI
jgi:hypothetical protein